MGQSLRKEDVSKNPVDPFFREALGFHEQGKFSEACALYRQALQADPRHAASWLNLGMVLRKLGHGDAALMCSSRALALSPGNPSYLTNHGNGLVEFGREDEALAAHAAAVKARPDDALIQKNYGLALREFGHFEQALAHFEIARKIKPQDISTLWDMAITYLYLGRFSEGWAAFESRWQVPPLKERACDAPRWRGEDLEGKTLLVYEEQGFGDTILCSRYIPMIKARGGRVILECRRPLHRLFSSLPGVSQIVEPGTGAAFDYHIPMMSLPGVFGTDLSSIPPPAIRNDAPLPEGAAQALKFGEGRLKVGIVWSGSVTFANNHKRAVRAERFMPLAEIPGVQLYSLQKGPCEEELAACGATGIIPELAPYMNDFADTAAILKQLDLVIMTDSAVAHLAGSLDVPVWNLLHHRPYWLYLSGREDSPWYKSMRLFRQPGPGDWDAVFRDVADALSVMAGHK